MTYDINTYLGVRALCRRPEEDTRVRMAERLEVPTDPELNCRAPEATGQTEGLTYTIYAILGASSLEAVGPHRCRRSPLACHVTSDSWA